MAVHPPVRVALEFVKGNMRLARPICDANGRLLASTGTLLTESIVRLLRRAAIQSVQVTSTTDIPPWEVIQPLEQELTVLHERIAREKPDSGLQALGAAVERHLRARAAQLDREDTANAERA